MYMYIHVCFCSVYLIGDKVAKMLDKKISEFLDNGGKISPRIISFSHSLSLSLFFQHRDNGRSS